MILFFKFIEVFGRRGLQFNVATLNTLYFMRIPRKLRFRETVRRDRNVRWKDKRYHTETEVQYLLPRMHLDQHMATIHNNVYLQERDDSFKSCINKFSNCITMSVV